VAETTTLTAAQTGNVTTNTLIQEALTLLDTEQARADFIGLLAETMVLAEVLIARGWIKINDNQTANWANINNAGGGSWTTINDTQNPGWTQINDFQG
jgi:hypothetical protein